MNILELINLEIKLRNIFIKLLSQKNINVEEKPLVELSKITCKNYPQYEKYFKDFEKEEFSSMYSIDKRIKIVENAISNLEGAFAA